VPRTLTHAQLRVMLPVAMISSVLNNTPVVAIFIPAINDWAKRHRLSVSKLMLPLSYASIAGGTCTLIGTSTNLVINGLLTEHTGEPSLALFDLAIIGVPVTLTVIAYVLVAQKYLLPDRQPAQSYFANVKEYSVEMTVEPGSPLDGKSIESAGLRQLPGLYLIEIERGGRILSAVGPKQTLAGNDHLVFVGMVDSIVDLQRIPGLKPATNQVFKLNADFEDHCLTEAVISSTSPVIGKTIRDSRFRSIYNSAIIGVARNGERIKRKIGDIVLQAGDTLLMISHPEFFNQQHNSKDFYLVNGVAEVQPVRHRKAPVAIGILLLMLLSVAFGWLTMLQSSMLAAGLMLITRCTNGRIARRSVNWQILIVIAASFGIAQALMNSGAATAIASALLTLAGNSAMTSLVLVFVMTSLLSAIATNNAAAVIMFPIALSASQALNASLLPFAIVIMIGASASFATPIGYQTNLMVYGAGGYRFSDYLRFGIPLTLLVGITTVVVTPLRWAL
jgi:di/tricarboxylate transporter